MERTTVGPSCAQTLFFLDVALTEEPIAFFPDASSSNSNPGADDDKSERSEVENGRIMGRVKLGPHAVKELLMDPHLRAQCEDIEDLSEGQLSEYYIALAEGEA